MPTTIKTPISYPPEELASQALARAIAHAGTPGAKTAIAKAMSELTGQAVNRQMVERWLHPDPERRHQPSLGYGLALVWTVEAMISDTLPPRPTTLAIHIHKPKTTTKKTTNEKAAASK